jgi:hypothetical protein
VYQANAPSPERTSPTRPTQPAAAAAAAAAAATPVAVGTSASIPRGQLTYEPIEANKLGQGAFGVVFRGRWQSIPVAIKSLHLQAADDALRRELAAEANVMSNLRHPNILILYGAATDVAPFLMVLELMDTSLDKLLSSPAPLPWSLRYRIGADIGSGLAYLEVKGIVHRDLKSMNVLLDKVWARKFILLFFNDNILLFLSILASFKIVTYCLNS